MAACTTQHPVRRRDLLLLVSLVSCYTTTTNAFIPVTSRHVSIRSGTLLAREPKKETSYYETDDYKYDSTGGDGDANDDDDYDYNGSSASTFEKKQQQEYRDPNDTFYTTLDPITPNANPLPLEGSSFNTLLIDEPTSAAAPTTDKSHFYSQKSLLETPTFLYQPSTLSSDADKKKQQNAAQLKRSKDVFTKLVSAVSLTQPSRIQSLSWPVLLDPTRHAIIADQTGSGKTLAYLIPLLQRMVLTEESSSSADKTNPNDWISAEDQKKGKTKRVASPKIVILAPTSELAHQIHAVCKTLAKSVNFRSLVCTGGGNDPYSRSRSNTHSGEGSASQSSGETIRHQIRDLTHPHKPPVDILIATPGRISSFLTTKALSLANLQSIVLDEVDVLLLEETFGPQLQTVGVNTPQETQFVFCTATLPDAIQRKVQNEFPGVKVIKGPGLHRVAPTISEHLIDVSIQNTKRRRDNEHLTQQTSSSKDLAACFDIKADQLFLSLRRNKCDRTLIFCNTVENCRKVENLLRRTDKQGKVYHVGSYHGAMNNEARSESLYQFTNDKPPRNERTTTPQKRSNNRNNRDRNTPTSNAAVVTAPPLDKVLICTDRAARGVDFAGKTVDHVLIFDFPSDPAEYVRRVGRTGRAGKSGVCTVFAYGWQLPIARKLINQQKKPTKEAQKLIGSDDAYQFVGGGNVQGTYVPDIIVEGKKGKNMKKKRKWRDDMDGSDMNKSIASGKMWRDHKHSR